MGGIDQVGKTKRCGKTDELVVGVGEINKTTEKQ